jgi:hypothetical protein
MVALVKFTLHLSTRFTIEMPSVSREHLDSSHTNLRYQVCIAIEIATLTDTI